MHFVVPRIDAALFCAAGAVTGSLVLPTNALESLSGLAQLQPATCQGHIGELEVWIQREGPCQQLRSLSKSPITLAEYGFRIEGSCICL